MVHSFDYQALDNGGHVVKGSIAAASERHAVRAIEAQGLAPLSILPAKGATAPARQFFQRRPQTQEIVLSLKQLSLLLTSGVPMIRAIETLKQQKLHPDISAGFADLERRLRSGQAFTTSLPISLPMLPSYVGQLAAAGEAIGRLGEAMSDAVLQMSYEHQVRQDIRNALTYPAVLISAGLTAVIFIFIVVVPRFQSMLAQAKAPLPWISTVVLNTGIFLNNHRLLLILFAAAVVAGVTWALRNKAFMSALRERAAKLPILGSWLLESDLARWAFMLGTMFANGVELTKSLDLARDSVSLPSLRVRLEQVSKMVRAGKSLSAAMAEQRAFNDTAVSLVQVGEESGRLDEMLRSLAKLYDDSGRQRMKQFLILLEPAAILLIGIVVGGIVAAIMLAITSINQVAL
ncbi:MAG: type II secretion system F family protein [Rhodospirillaceae bacterium]|nr:type II secretion system F family protein [Rhodospirillaceae bacterium]